MINDENLKITIRGPGEGQLISSSFDGYLNESSISYSIIDTDLPLWTLNYSNHKIANRVVRTAKFSFDVFTTKSSDLEKNIEKLENIIINTKPYYSPDQEKLPEVMGLNNSGLIIVKCDCGLPQMLDEVQLSLTNFQYEVNKDLGYVLSASHLYPLSYKITLEGIVISSLAETINILGESDDNNYVLSNDEIRINNITLIVNELLRLRDYRRDSRSPSKINNIQELKKEVPSVYQLVIRQKDSDGVIKLFSERLAQIIAAPANK